MSTTHFKYLILGAGPSGLAFANTLLLQGEHSFLVLEQESEPGGLCRSVMVDGAPLDIGGGHFLDVKRRDALNFLFRFLPESEWSRFKRVAKIRLLGSEVDHPLEANLWQLPLEVQVNFLESMAQARALRGEAVPPSFEDWIPWHLGRRIAEAYMLPYNRKLWRRELNRLGTYWLYKLPEVSFRDTLVSCLSRNGKASLPAHAEFLYPLRFGYGEVWRRMGQALGEKLLTDTPVTHLELPERRVNRAFTADTIVNTIPWTTWAAVGNLPLEVTSAITELVHVPVDIDYHAETLPGTAHWIYEPDEKVSYHRILCRNNFCQGAHGYWTETNATISPPSTAFRHRNEFAYPVNTAEKPAALAVINRWAQPRGVIPLGRWGQWEHMNSDVAVSLAMAAAKSSLQAIQA